MGDKNRKHQKLCRCHLCIITPNIIFDGAHLELPNKRKLNRSLLCTELEFYGQLYKLRTAGGAAASDNLRNYLAGQISLEAHEGERNLAPLRVTTWAKLCKAGGLSSWKQSGR